MQKLVSLLTFATAATLAFHRWRQREKFHALLYVMAANAWLSSCHADGDRIVD